MIKKILIVLIIIGGIFWLWRRPLNNYQNFEIVPLPATFIEKTATTTQKSQSEPIAIQPLASSTKTTTTEQVEVNITVPFIVQAPRGDWNDPRQEDACEEASTLMAVYWARNQSLNAEIALTEILKMADWEKENYGSYTDTSASTTVERLFKEYFHYSDAKVKYNIKIDDIIKELKRGHIVIIPTNGQALGNPNFKAPGPERHNVLIRGYDYETKEFITNDPGTRKGENYRYDEDILFEAIRDYPTGDHLPITENIKAMIVVSKPN